jgi:hypothetical protein
MSGAKSSSGKTIQAFCLYITKTGGMAIEIYVPPGGPGRITLGPGELFSWSALPEAATRNRNHQSH